MKAYLIWTVLVESLAQEKFIDSDQSQPFISQHFLMLLNPSTLENFLKDASVFECFTDESLQLLLILVNKVKFQR